MTGVLILKCSPRPTISTSSRPTDRRPLRRSIPFHTATTRKKYQLRSSSESNEHNTPLAVILECDGAVVDVHDGHRVAFNRAFEELSHSCVNWTPPIYYDLLRLGDGTGEGMVKTYYEMTGWPMMLPTKERAIFATKVHNKKCEIMAKMATRGEIPLRPGVTEFIDDALADCAKLVLLSGTASCPEDSILSSAMFNLGPSRSSKIQSLTVGKKSDEREEEQEEEEGEPAGTEEEEDGSTLSLEDMVNQATCEAKTMTAKSFARAMNLTGRGVGMTVDPSLIASKERATLITPGFLAAIIAALGVSASQSVLVAANHSIMQAAAAVGIFTAGVPPSLAKRGGYAAMQAGFDGFGPGGGVTYRKLQGMMQQRKE